MASYQQPVILSIFDRLENREELVSLAQVGESGYYFILESGLSDIAGQSITLALWVAGVVLLTVVSTAFLTYITSQEYINEIDRTYQEAEKFKLAVESSGNHIIITDPDGKIIFANSAAEKITGYSLSEIIGSNPRLWGGLMGKEFYQQMWHQIKVEKIPFKGEIRNKRKSGEEYYALMTISPIIGAKKRLVGFVGLEEDITDRKIAEEKIVKQSEILAEEKAKAEAILASIGDGVIVVDIDGKTLLLNQASQRLLGWTSEEVVGRSFRNTWYLKDALGNIVTSGHPIDTALTGETVSTSDYYITRRDGSDFPAHITVSPVKLIEKVVGAIMSFHDISQEKAIDRAKSEFVSLASHQLRTPLSAVNWYAEMLLSGDLGAVDPSQKKYLEEIYESNKRMVELVNALLNVSRIDLGTFAIEPESVNVIGLAKSVVMELRPQVVFKKLLLTENYDPNVPVMQADPKLIRILVQNMMTNAVKYTPPGGKIGLDIQLVGKGGKVGIKTAIRDSVLIQVSDNGYGIPEAAKEKIFTKLFRADNVKERETEGTGLGLYIVKSIVEAAGGGVWFDSVENQGSTFYVLLPLSGMIKREGTKQLSYDVFSRIFVS